MFVIAGLPAARDRMGGASTGLLDRWAPESDGPGLDTDTCAVAGASGSTLTGTTAWRRLSPEHDRRAPKAARPYAHATSRRTSGCVDIRLAPSRRLRRAARQLRKARMAVSGHDDTEGSDPGAGDAGNRGARGARLRNSRFGTGNAREGQRRTCEGRPVTGPGLLVHSCQSQLRWCRGHVTGPRSSVHSV